MVNTSKRLPGTEREVLISILQGDLLASCMRATSRKASDRFSCMPLRHQCSISASLRFVIVVAAGNVECDCTRGLGKDDFWCGWGGDSNSVAGCGDDDVVAAVAGGGDNDDDDLVADVAVVRDGDDDVAAVVVGDVDDVVADVAAVGGNDDDDGVVAGIPVGGDDDIVAAVSAVGGIGSEDDFTAVAKAASDDAVATSDTGVDTDCVLTLAVPVSVTVDAVVVVVVVVAPVNGFAVDNVVTGGGSDCQGGCCC